MCKVEQIVLHAQHWVDQHRKGSTRLPTSCEALARLLAAAMHASRIETIILEITISARMVAPQLSSLIPTQVFDHDPAFGT